MIDPPLGYIIYNGVIYAYDNPTGLVWKLTNGGFKKIDRDKLPERVHKEMLKEMI